MIFGRQRIQFRQVFIDVWCKHCQGAPLEPLEQAIAAVIGAHPEYHGMLAQPDALSRNFPVDGEGVAGQGSNPFLHMGMHITIVEQISSDRPAGIRAVYDALRGRFHHSHALEHAMMQCLTESLLEARERNQPPDESRYLACVRLLRGPVR
jgi:hypothetical protein